jgi:hypothetical protein
MPAIKFLQIVPYVKFSGLEFEINANANQARIRRKWLSVERVVCLLTVARSKTYCQVKEKVRVVGARRTSGERYFRRGARGLRPQFEP